MAERSVEELVAEVIESEAAVSSVPLSAATEVAEGLAEAEQPEQLSLLADRAFPRLVKKERIAEIEEMWLACCTAGALPLPLMQRTVERLATRGHAEAAAELLVMLAETLVEHGRGEDALEVLQTGGAHCPGAVLFDAAKLVFSAVFDGASNLSRVLRGLGKSVNADADVDAGEELRQAVRALRFAPGSYLQWTDYMIAQVVSTDGVTATVRHPSGTTEKRPVDEEPPPRVLSAKNHEVRRLYDFDELRADWKSDPTKVLLPLLEESGGVLSVSGLTGILVPRILTEAQLETAVGHLKTECGIGREGRPTYESRRRLFVAPGCEAPPPTTTPSKPRQATQRLVTVEAAPRSTSRPPSVEPLDEPVATNVRWADLTLLPQIRQLITNVEQDVAELNHELNADLPVRLEEALAHGDLKENAEYDAAKERLRFVQARVGQLRSWLAQLYELSRVRLIPGQVTVMSVVDVADEETGEERSLRLVPAELPEPRLGDVSIGTPYAKALLGKVAGAVVKVQLPRRTEKLCILTVQDPDQ